MKKRKGLFTEDLSEGPVRAKKRRSWRELERRFHRGQEKYESSCESHLLAIAQGSYQRSLRLAGKG